MNCKFKQQQKIKLETIYPHKNMDQPLSDCKKKGQRFRKYGIFLIYMSEQMLSCDKTETRRKKQKSVNHKEISSVELKIVCYTL